MISEWGCGPSASVSSNATTTNFDCRSGYMEVSWTGLYLLIKMRVVNRLCKLLITLDFAPTQKIKDGKQEDYNPKTS